MVTRMWRGVLPALIVGLLCVSTMVAAQSAPSSDVPVVDTYRAKLQSQLDELESQIAIQQNILNQTKNQDVSLQRDIKILNAQITQAQLAIKARDLAVMQLSGNVQEKETAIHVLNTKLNGELESLSAILREKDQLDTTPLMVALLSSQSLSEFFSDLETFDQINARLQESFTHISATKQVTQQQKDTLATQLEEETQLRLVQQLQKVQIQQKQGEKQKILADTKGQEKLYQSVIGQNRKSAAQIRAALFQLTGTAAIPFGKALEYAYAASKETGIRPAFLLGIIAEESNLGENVGKGTWTVDMKAPRDTEAFKSITSSLGLNPDTMPVSKKPWYGWGGAMGPAQFIPSTWMCFAGYINSVTGKCSNSAGTGDWTYTASSDRVGKRTGNTPPNPWSPQDAFMAAALYLTDSGADNQSTSAEFKAAMCYLAGCGNVNNKSLQFYGQQVASLATKYQCQIDILNGIAGSASC